MNCPKCEASMELQANAFSEYAQCSSCKGLWLDSIEDKKLRLAAAAVDAGDPELGKKYNDMHEVFCPICPNNEMLRMVDPIQPHIWFEQCPTCYGRFYDAGEFKDLAEKSVSDFFKRFTAKERN